MKALKSLAIGSVFALGACSGGIGSKQDAANAVSHLMVASLGAQTSAMVAGSTEKITVGGTATVTGKSGSASVTYQASGTGGSGSATYAIDFSKFSYDGKNTFDGSETFELGYDTTSSSAQVKETLKADLTMSGAYSAELTCDVTISVSATELSATSGKVSMTINGTVAADGKSYTFNNETLNVDVQP